jgi:CDP-glucose 4,6-dehydratase
MRNFWKNKKVLLTGYEGFLGSWLTRLLLEQGAKIVGLDILTHRKKTLLSSQELKRIKIIKGSVESFSLLGEILKKYETEFVFHLAAKALVGECQKNPKKAFGVNIGGTWNILEACRKNRKVKGIIVASSDKAYGRHKNLPYKEDCGLKGSHPYDVSKSCADLIAYTYYHTYQLPVCITRCGNLYGPGDFNFSRIVPDAIRSALKNRTLLIRSDGKFVRDYVYVKDIALAYICLAEKMLKLGIKGEAFNFSAEKPLSVLGMVKAIYKEAAKTPDYKILNQAKYEIKEQFLSSVKARKILRWKPRYSLKRALKETIHWYQTMLGGKK